MKVFIFFALFALILSNSFVNRKFVESLKKAATFEIYEPEENPFLSWTDEEIKSILNLKFDINDEEIIQSTTKMLQEKNFPESYDFRISHPECITPVRNQEKCGSCWAFSGVMTLQERFCLKSNGKIKVILSPQDPISCDPFDHGCDGGMIHQAWIYYKARGIVEEDCFPYSSGAGTVEECIKECKNGQKWEKFHAANYQKINGTDTLKAELFENGPINTSFLVYKDFMNYKSGIYIRNSDEMAGGHAVVIIGYGKEEDIDFWICKNSWGEDWGESGYFRIKIGECNIGNTSEVGEPLLN